MASFSNVALPIGTDSIIAVALLATAALITLFFAFLYNVKRQSYLFFWTAGWALLALHHIGPIFEPLSGWAWLGPLDQWLLALSSLLFLAGAQQYTHGKPWFSGAIAGALAFGAWAILYGAGWVPVAPYLGIMGVFFVTSWVFWQEGRKQESVADQLLAGAFALWGLLLLGTLFREQAAAVVTREIRIVVVIPELFVAGLMVMAFYEEEKRRVERNMLALSNLNLATSSFVGGEIQRMLAQALERVLSVVRIPCGGLCLQHGDRTGPKSVVTIGLGDFFCAGLQENDLDDYLVSQVARLGGLVVFRDLARDTSWTALEREESFRRLRKLAMEQQLQSLVGISLQARERVFGVLLLGTYDNRRFAPAELRLLLALGHQIGMAVENSYLIQQTARRTEELHVLNEIGRALSSTLDTGSLFEKIYDEMRRLFDAANFYIAFYDNTRDEIRFELEVVDGKRLPKRTRHAGNHLTEHMIRSRQPVLIRDRFAEEARKLGAVPLQQTGCFCGVPLVLYEKAIGVMAVHSPQERLFDEGHLEIMRVLASEACIAMENARLFSEEQKKSRHLTLLNNVSRHGIAGLNPDEMLARIGAELEDGLQYEHIGIGMLDYNTKEVVIQAEAGRRRAEASVLGQRVPLSEGLVGQVARTGQMVVVRSGGESSARTVHPDSVSAIALPIIYGDQLIAVLNAETREPYDFSDEEILLLRTLADVIAGALHNALTFQKAQEQAITDGLTGVKTHRYFMEALSAEWKRATRAGRSFALVLMDLDRFKFVNDFYGHLEGDVVLQRIGQILEQNCRRSDVVARYGGDEFVILMPETNVDQARQLAGKLRAWVASDPLLREKNITASFGIACFPIHGSTPQELIQVADASMYLSKHQGGNAVSTADHYDPNEAKKWKRDVLEAYLGVTLKRLFTTGPEAFEEIYRRLQQFTQSLEPAGPIVEGKAGEVAPVPSGAEGPAEPAAAQGIQALNPAVIETLTSLAFAIDAKDHYTQGHSQKVSTYAVLLAQGLAAAKALSDSGDSTARESGSSVPDVRDSDIEEIRLAGLLHDVGKVGIPEAILNKVGPLDPDEWETMKTHAALGGKILEPLRGIASIQRMVRHHHEFVDGSGYPDGLSGDAIPLGARLITIADAYDTITSERTYKKARGAEAAFAELERCAGAQFDATLVRVFIDTMRRQPSPIANGSVPSNGVTSVRASNLEPSSSRAPSQREN